MKVIDKGKMRTIEFNSFDEFLHEVRTKPREEDNNSASADNSAKKKWDMNAGWDGANELASRGWKAGLTKMARVRSLVELPDQSDRSIQAQPFFSDEGDEVDIDRYLAGETECMIQFTPELTPSYGRVAKVIVNLAASCGVDSDTMYRRGAAACILIDALESAGVRCEVWVMPNTEKGRQHTFHSKVLVKRPDEHVEPDRMAFMLAHPAVMRRLGFRLVEQQPPDTWGKITWQGYGRPDDITEAEQQEAGTIYFGRQYSQYHTDEDMVREVNRILAKYLEVKETPEYA